MKKLDWQLAEHHRQFGHCIVHCQTFSLSVPCWVGGLLLSLVILWVPYYCTVGCLRPKKYAWE